MKNTSERLAVIETEMKNTTQKLRDVEETNTKEHAEIKKLIADFIKGADDRYARKEVETWVKGAIGIIVVSVLSAIIYLVIPNLR